MPDAPLNTRGFYGRFMCNTPRKISLLAGLSAIMALVIGAGFASMSASGTTTTLETLVVRWVAVGCLAIGGIAYVIGGRLLRESEG
jgi:hypothetical protein